MSILVTGGAGYIGSHVVHQLVHEGHDVVVIDNLTTGHRSQVPRAVPFLEADVGDRAKVPWFLRRHRVAAVLHLAARSRNVESLGSPRLYYAGNLTATIALLESALEAGIGELVFSSSAAVYGAPQVTPITEDYPTAPLTPYGETVLTIEHVLSSYALAYPFRYAALRCFNAAGADVEAGLAERHQPESHLIPVVLEAALGKRAYVTVHGADHPTPDGTCVRDFVHVRDLVDAHLAALDYLRYGGASGVFNIGTGRGHSVREVIAVAYEITGRDIPVVVGPRLVGDPPVLVASARRAKEQLAWRPRRSALTRMIRDAWWPYVRS